MRRPFLRLAVRIPLILAIWYLWLAGGLSGALWLHHRWQWRDSASQDLKEAFFVPLRRPSGSRVLRSVAELEQRGLGGMALDPDPPREELLAALKSFESSKPYFPPIVRVKVIAAPADPRSQRVEIVAFRGGLSEWRWRIRLEGDRLQFLQWYDIHDTAGLLLLQYALIFWIPAFFLARWLTRRVWRSTASSTPAA